MFGLFDTVADKVADFFSPAPRASTYEDMTPATPEEAMCIDDSSIGAPPDPAVLAAIYPDEDVVEEEWTEENDPLGQIGREEDEDRIARLGDPVPPGTSGVEFCERSADIPVIGEGGLELAHWWLRTANVEAGMGPDDGSVPGEQRSADYPGMPTTINDHTGRGEFDGSTCYPVEEHTGFAVDQACVEDQLALGRETGRWLPPFNDCHTVVDSILERCRTFDGGLVWGEY